MIRRPPRSTRTDTLFPYTTLFRAKVTARADLEAARADYEAAAAQAAGASGAAEAAGVSGRFISVRSPISGRVTAAPALLGSYVSAETELFRIADPSVAQAEVSVRSEERRVGKECVRQCRSRGVPAP